MKFFVTGATGYIGSALVDVLETGGHEVVAFHRPGSDLSALEGRSCEKRVGDLFAVPDLREGMRGCDGVFHVAGNTSWYRGDRAEVWRANVESTKVVVRAMAEAEVKRGVLTSSVSAIGVNGPADRPADERTPHNWPGHFHYPQSKKAAEEAWFGSDPSREMMAVNPATIMGPGDRGMKVGAIFRKIGTGKFPRFLCGGISVADVRDVARGHLQAFEKGTPGERYILGAENIANGALGDAIARAMEVPLPKKELGPRKVKIFLKVAGGIERVGGRLEIAAGHLWCLLRHVYHDTTKARRELGFATRPFGETLRESVEWYRANGLLDG
jgi:dihydroflavonol-4-reductase